MIRIEGVWFAKPNPPRPQPTVVGVHRACLEPGKFYIFRSVNRHSCLGGSHVKRFRGGLVFEALRLLNHSTLGLRVIKKKKARNLAGEARGVIARLVRRPRPRSVCHRCLRGLVVKAHRLCVSLNSRLESNT